MFTVSTTKLLSKEQDFIDKAIKVHGDKYDYSDTVYTKFESKVNIRCKVHGIFTQKPGNHLQGKGCPTCASITIGDKRRLTTDMFIEKAKAVHGDTYEYSLTKYITSKDKVSITCITHGTFEQSPCNHLSGQGCPECGKHSSQDGKRLDTVSFIKKAKELHGDRYDYSKSVYGSSNADKVTIECKEHGEFKQAPSKHLSGHGCPACKVEKLRTKPNTWSYSSWERAGSISDNFEGYSLYVIECSSKSTGERFIKVGKTFVGIASRFKSADAMPYKYKVLTQVYHNAYAISILEEQIKNKLKEYKYVPKKEFAGMQECLTLEAKDLAIELAEA